MTNSVEFKRKDYLEAQKRWTIVSDVVAGSEAVKAKGDDYLPRPNPLDKSDHNRERYKQYLARAMFFNVTGRTLDGLIGALYRKAPTVTLPAALDFTLENVDGNSNGLNQQSQEVARDVLSLGRLGLWVDMPERDGQITKADLAVGLHRPKIIATKAGDVINWQTNTIGASQVYSLIVIAEQWFERDGFEEVERDQYRVLKLEEGIYTVSVYRQATKTDGGKKQGEWYVESEYIPLDSKGNAWNEIPFTFVGAQNNDHKIDKPPMLDLAEVNLKHYCNSADYEDSVFIVGQPQPWLSGLSEQWRDHLEKAGIHVGSGSPILLPEGGRFGIEQVQPNTLVESAMDRKEKQMIALGAQLVEKGGAIKTATEAQAENESSHSVLSLASENISAAYTQCLKWAARFAGAAEDSIAYELSREFSESKIDAQMLTALIGAWQSGRFPSSDLWDTLKKNGFIDPEKTTEDIEEELSQDDSGLNLDDDLDTPDAKVQALIDQYT